MVARVIVDIRDQRVEAHSAKEIGSVFDHSLRTGTPPIDVPIRIRFSTC